MSDENVQITLHEQLSNAFDEVESAEPVETKEERARDESGRFVSKESGTVSEAPTTDSGSRVSAGTMGDGQSDIADPPAKPRPQRPSSWKKEYWEDWDKLDPRVAEYFNQRENEMAAGVAPLKAQAESAREILGAIAPYQSVLQQYNIHPAKHIGELLAAHQALALGSPEQKLMMFQKLANDYQVPLNLPQPDQQSQWLINQISSLRGEIDGWKTSQQRAEMQQMQGQIEAFKSEADHPHFEELRETMAQLLEAGVAEDLKSAYNKAMRLHDGIWQQEQERLAKTAEQERLHKAQELTKRAKSNQISPRSATPTTVAKESGNKSLTSMLESAFDEHVTGRI